MYVSASFTLGRSGVQISHPALLGIPALLYVAYDTARNIAFPYDYGLMLGRRACVEGAMVNALVVGISVGPRGLPISQEECGDTSCDIL